MDGTHVIFTNNRNYESHGGLNFRILTIEVSCETLRDLIYVSDAEVIEPATRRNTTCTWQKEAICLHQRSSYGTISANKQSRFDEGLQNVLLESKGSSTSNLSLEMDRTYGMEPDSLVR